MYIIAQKIKKRTRPRRVTGTFPRYIIPNKKAPAHAEASTTTAIVSLLQSEGRRYTPFRFILFRGLLFTYLCNRPSTGPQPIAHCLDG